MVKQFEKRDKLLKCYYRMLGLWPPAPAAPAQGFSLLRHWSPTQCSRDLELLSWLQVQMVTKLYSSSSLPAGSVLWTSTNTAVADSFQLVHFGIYQLIYTHPSFTLGLRKTQMVVPYHKICDPCGPIPGAGLSRHTY